MASDIDKIVKQLVQDHSAGELLAALRKVCLAKSKETDVDEGEEEANESYGNLYYDLEKITNQTLRRHI